MKIQDKQAGEKLINLNDLDPSEVAQQIIWHTIKEMFNLCTLDNRLPGLMWRSKKFLWNPLKKIIFGNKHMVPRHGKRWDQIRPAGYQIKLLLK